MPERSKSPVNPISDREILNTRVLDAPRELVFKAFSDPDHLARWWGPKEFTNTLQEFHLRPGGAWRVVMHDPDGGHFQNERFFVEVVRPERIVYNHVSGPNFRMTITLAEHCEKAKVTWCMYFDTAAERNKVKSFAVEANEENLDRLEAQLETMA